MSDPVREAMTELFTVHRGNRTVLKPVDAMAAGEVMRALDLEPPDRAARLREIVEGMRPAEFDGGPLHATIALWWPQP